MIRRFALLFPILVACVTPQGAAPAFLPDNVGLLKLQVKAVGPSGWHELVPGATLQSRDRLDLAVEVSQEAHLYVVQWTAKESLSVLSPGEGGTPIKALPNHVVHLPGSGKWFQLDDTPGSEVLYVIASPHPMATPAVKALIASGRFLDEREPPPTVSDKKRGSWLQTMLTADRAAVLRFPYQHQ